MSAKVVNKTAKEIFIYVAILFILFLTSINIDNFLKVKTIKVLGAETANKESVFWQDFLSNNPDYVPGWIEVGNTEKAKSIDPNYTITP